jgi:outer membrane protein assembly factor BamD (BamD/ComL family)
MRAFVNVLQQSRLWEESERQIRDYRKVDKQDGFMALELATSLRSQMDFTAAAEELLLFGDSQPQNWQIALNYLQQFPDDSTIHPRVLSVLKKAVQQNKKSASNWRLYAGYALKAGELETSLTASIAADSLSAGGGTLVLASAQSLLGEGDVALARRGFQKVLDLKPAADVQARAELGLGRCLESLEKWGEAKAAYENFISQHPAFKEVDEARFRMADIELNHERNAASALVNFKGLQQRGQGPWKVQAGIKVGDCHAWMGEFDSAIHAWGDVVQLAGGNASEDAGQALLKMARANFWRDSLNAAFKMLDSITAGNVGNTAFNDAINWTALLEEGGVHRAQRAFAEADYAGFKSEDSLAAARYGEAAGLIKSGKLAQYCRYFEAVSWRKAGAFSVAVAVLDSFALNYPESVDLDRAKYLRALIKLEDLKEYAAAKTELEQFLIDHPRSIYLEQARRKARILAARVSS